MRALVLLGITAGIVSSSLTTPANAVATTAYLSRTGTGSACTLATPCSGMVSAISVAGAGGEVVCLDKGNYNNGTVIISFTLTISCGDGLWEAPQGNVIITLPAGAAAVIEGLVIDNETNSSGPMVSFSGQGTVHLNRVRLGNSTSGNNFAIKFHVITGAAKLFIADSFIYNVGASGISGAIHLLPNPGTTADVVIERTRIENNRFGIVADGTSNGIIRGVVRDSVIAGNVNNGITVSTNSSSVVLSVDGCTIAGNNFGLVAGGSNAGLLVGRSVISANNTGLFTTSGGALLSYGDNRVNANTSDGAFTGAVGLK
jgi:hypothetical protein